MEFVGGGLDNWITGGGNPPEDEEDSDCISGMCACSKSYAEGCGAYVGRDE